MKKREREKERKKEGKDESRKFCYTEKRVREFERTR